MFDVFVKWAVLAAIAAWLTRRSRHADAENAHRLWLLVLGAPLALLASSALLQPVAFVVPRSELPLPPLTTLGAWIPTIYVMVVVLLLGRIAAGALGVAQLRRQAHRLVTVDLERLRRAAGDTGLDIREAGLKVPVTAGFVRPCVILPRNWRTLSDAGLTAILRHEAAHVRRHDCAVSLAAAVVEALFWIHPAAWITARRLRWFAEMACDAQAARSMGSESYAAELLALSAGWAGVRSPRYAITAGAETSIAKRIRLLIERTRGNDRRSLVLVAALLVLAVGTPASSTVRFAVTRGVAVPTVFDHSGRHTHPAYFHLRGH